MNNKTYTVNVYNTSTKKYEDVIVTEEIYVAYRRSEWNIEKKNKSFYDHEIQFSGLIGGEDGNYENFHEFVSNNDNPEHLVVEQLFVQALYKAFNTLNDSERALIEAIYFDRKSEQAYSDETGIPRKTINNRKRIILGKMKEKLKF